jgi:DNA-binding MarR family transcriptional regulator
MTASLRWPPLGDAARSHAVGVTNHCAILVTVSSPDLGFTDALVQLSYTVQGILAEIGEREDLSLTQARLLGALRDRTLRMQDIAAFLGLEKSSATGLVDRAERRGLLRRAASPSDGRSVLVTLSPAGRRHIARIARDVESALLQHAASMSASERADLSRLASQFVGPNP